MGLIEKYGTNRESVTLQDAMQDVDGGGTGLMMAVMGGAFDVAELLLVNSADANVKNEFGHCALLMCQMVVDAETRIRLVELLLQYGADVDISDVNGNTLLTQAVLRGDTELMATSLRHGASIDVPVPPTNQLWPIVKAAREHPNPQVLDMLLSHTLEQGKQARQLAEVHQLQLAATLLLAAFSGLAATMDQLLRLGVDPNTTAVGLPFCPQKKTSKRWAYPYKALEYVCVRLSQECLPPVGSTALHIAAKQGHTNCCTLLIKNGTAIDAADSNGTTPFHLACSHGRLTVFTLLAEAGCQLFVKDNLGFTAREMAREQNQIGDLAEQLTAIENCRIERAENARAAAAAREADEARERERVAERLQEQQWVDAQLDRARLMVQTAKLEHAVQAASDAISIATNSRQLLAALCIRGRCYLQLEKLAKAAKDAATACELDAASAEAAELQADVSQTQLAAKTKEAARARLKEERRQQAATQRKKRRPKLSDAPKESRVSRKQPEIASLALLKMMASKSAASKREPSRCLDTEIVPRLRGQQVEPNVLPNAQSAAKASVTAATGLMMAQEQDLGLTPELELGAEAGPSPKLELELDPTSFHRSQVDDEDPLFTVQNGPQNPDPGHGPQSEPDFCREPEPGPGPETDREAGPKRGPEPEPEAEAVPRSESAIRPERDSHLQQDTNHKLQTVEAKLGSDAQVDALEEAVQGHMEVQPKPSVAESLPVLASTSTRADHEDPQHLDQRARRMQRRVSSRGGGNASGRRRNKPGKRGGANKTKLNQNAEAVVEIQSMEQQLTAESDSLSAAAVAPDLTVISEDRGDKSAAKGRATKMSGEMPRVRAEVDADATVKYELGMHILSQVQTHQVAMAGKITGMILENKVDTLSELLGDQSGSSLTATIDEATRVLLDAAATKATTTQEVIDEDVSEPAAVDAGQQEVAAAFVDCSGPWRQPADGTFDQQRNLSCPIASNEGGYSPNAAGPGYFSHPPWPAGASLISVCSRWNLTSAVLSK
eukprot:SAG31_NODE_1369_length_8611_cov_3.505169_3_plen_1008_part_00